MNRTEAREYLIQIVFQMETQEDFSEEALDRYFELQIEDDDIKQKKYIKAVCEAIRNNKDEIDATIEKYSKGWKLNRIAKVDLSAMRVSLAESYYLPEEDRIPTGASINEAVKLAKKFGSENSGKFVNGILGEISRDRV